MKEGGAGVCGAACVVGGGIDFLDVENVGVCGLRCFGRDVAVVLSRLQVY